MKRKMIAILMACAMLAGVLTGCSDDKPNELDADTPIASSEQTEIDSTVAGPVAHREGVQISDELKVADAKAPGFQVGNSFVKLGTSTVADLIQAGAEFKKDAVVHELTYSEDASGVRYVELLYNGAPFTVTVKNPENKVNEISKSVVIGVYADQGDLYAIGGIGIGDSADAVVAALGDPYAISDDETLKNGCGDMRAYKYSANWNDATVYIYTDRNKSTVTAFSETMPVNYVTSLDELSDDVIKSLIANYEVEAGEYLLRTPFLLDVENATNATGVMSDMHYTATKLFLLNNIKDGATFYMNAQDVASSVANSYLVVEYEGKLSFDEEQRAIAEFTEAKLEPEYNVHGCFYVLNPYFSDDGTLSSNLGLGLIRNVSGVFVDSQKMYDDIFVGADQGYCWDDYSCTEKAVAQ